MAWNYCVNWHTVEPSSCEVNANVRAVVEGWIAAPGNAVIGRKFSRPLRLIKQYWQLEYSVVVVLSPVILKIKTGYECHNLLLELTCQMLVTKALYKIVRTSKKRKLWLISNCLCIVPFHSECICLCETNLSSTPARSIHGVQIAVVDLGMVMTKSNVSALVLVWLTLCWRWLWLEVIVAEVHELRANPWWCTSRILNWRLICGCVSNIICLKL